MNCEEYMSITSFLYQEAELLDMKKYKEWLSLLADNFEYRVFLVEFGPYTEQGPKQIPVIDEDRKAIERRINRLYVEHAWAENPPSHTLRTISNIVIEKKDGEKYNVRSNLILHRDRGDTIADTIYAKRRDEIVSINGVLKLKGREVTIMETILKSRNLSVIL